MKNGGTEIKELQELSKLAILSPYVCSKGKRTTDRSVSIIALASPEKNKTTEILRFAETPGVRKETDLSYKGMIDTILPMALSGQVRTVVIPDLLKPIYKKADTAKALLTTLNSAIEEGVFELDLAGGTKNFMGARFNILTSMTPSIYMDTRTIMAKIGFCTRILPFTFKYTETRKIAVFDAIGNYDVDMSRYALDVPASKRAIEIAKDFSDVAQTFAEKLGKAEEITILRGFQSPEKVEGSEGFRHKWQFMTLLKTLALIREDSAVNDKDVRSLNNLAKWINYDFNPL